MLTTEPEPRSWISYSENKPANTSYAHRLHVTNTTNVELRAKRRNAPLTISARKSVPMAWNVMRAWAGAGAGGQNRWLVSKPSGKLGLMP